MRLFILLFLLNVLVFTGCEKTVGGGDDDTNEIPIPFVSPDDSATVPTNRLSEAEWSTRHSQKSTNPVYNQKIIFIGDSITQQWETSGRGLTQWNELNVKYDNKLTNLGFSADQTQHVIWRLQNGEFPEGINPEYVVLMIGTNNANQWHMPQSIAAGIGEIVRIINRASPKTKILLFSIFPRGSGNMDARTIINNRTNDIIINYDGYLNIQYVDITGSYLNPDGNLKTELFTDNLHLNSAGYEVWKNKLIEIIGG